MGSDASNALIRLGRIAADKGPLSSIDAVLSAFEASDRSAWSPEARRAHSDFLLLRSRTVRFERDVRAGLVGRDVQIAQWAGITEATLCLLDELAEIELKGRLNLALPDAVAASSPAPEAQRPAPAKGESDRFVFFSYSRADRERMLELASLVKLMGISGWYDHFIGGGQRFADVIQERLDRCCAVVVLWTETSATSDWVLFEASKAHQQNKLIPVRAPELEISKVPPPYAAVLNILTTDEKPKIEDAVRKFIAQPV